MASLPGEGCVLDRDCRGNKFYCEQKICACNWGYQLGGDDCAELTAASALPLTFLFITICYYIVCIVYAIRVVRRLPAVLQTLTAAERSGACCMPSRAACTAVWALLGMILLVLSELLGLTDTLSKAWNKLASSATYWLLQGVGATCWHAAPTA